MNKIHGLTLIELLITILITSILASVAGPSFLKSFDDRKLVSATEAVYSYIQLARSEAITRSKKIFISVNSSGTSNWSLGLSADAACDPSILSNIKPSACVLRVDDGDGLEETADDLVITRLVSTSHEDIILQKRHDSNPVSIDPARGIMSSTSHHLHFVLTSAQGSVVHMRTSLIGNIKICSDDISDYRKCN